jgi:hypothetical protein
MSTELKEVNDLVAKQGKQIETLTKSLETMVDKLKSTPANGASPEQVFGSPNIRHGEDPLSSRGFSFMKMLGRITGAVP